MRRFPEAYKTRFSAGETEIEDGQAQVTMFDSLYPGEVAHVQIRVEPLTGEVTHQTVIECAPGLLALLERVVFRIFKMGTVSHQDVVLDHNLHNVYNQEEETNE